MGYLVLFLGLICCAAKGYCGKRQSAFVTDTRDAMLINLIRMGCCTVFGLLVVLLTEGAGALIIGGAGLPVVLLSGISNAVVVVTWLLAVRGCAYMLLDVFATASVIVPMVVCLFLYGEQIRPIQWFGFALLITAVTVMCSYSAGIKGRKLSAADLAVLLIFTVFSGTTDLSYKLFVNVCPDSSKSVFNLYSFFLAGLLLAAALPFVKKKKGKAPFRPKKVLPYIVVMAILLFAVNFSKTYASSVLPAVQVFPLFQGGILILASLVAATFFGEKLTVKSVVGMVMTLAALVIINLL